MSIDKWDIAPHQPTGPSSRRRVFDAIVAACRAHPAGLDAAIRDLDHASEGFDTAVSRMMDARPALPGAASYDGPTSRGSSTSSTTEKHATTPDQTANDRATLDAMLRHLTHDATRLPNADRARLTANAWTLRRLVSAWTPRAASSRQRTEVERANTGNPECAVTRELLGIHEPVYRTSDLRGLLPEPTPVGRWLYDESKKLGRLPTQIEMRRWASRKDETRKQFIAASRS